MSALTTVLDDARIFLRGCDLSGQSNMATLEAESEAKDRSTFRSGGWKEVVGGQRKGSVTLAGFSEFGAAGTVDFDAWARLGLGDALTLSPTEEGAGELAFITKLGRLKHTRGGKVGDLDEWEASGTSMWPVVRSQYLLGPGAIITDDTTTSGANLGAVAAGQRLYATLHVLSVAGAAPQLDVTIESDTNSSFTSPVTVLTFTQATAVTGEILRTDGSAITDTWYRANLNVPDAAGDDSYLVAMAIGTA